MPKKIEELELDFALRTAVSDYHDLMIEQKGKKSKKFGSNGLLPNLQHSGDYWGECSVCEKMLKLNGKLK
jgi:hypothetical protein